MSAKQTVVYGAVLLAIGGTVGIGIGNTIVHNLYGEHDSSVSTSTTDTTAPIIISTSSSTQTTSDLCDAQQAPLDSPIQKRCQQLRDITHQMLHTIDPKGNYENVKIRLVGRMPDGWDTNGGANGLASEIVLANKYLDVLDDMERFSSGVISDNFLKFILAHEATHLILHHSQQQIALTNQQNDEVEKLKDECEGTHITPKACKIHQGQLRQQHEVDYKDARRRQESAANIISMYAMACQGLDPLNTWVKYNGGIRILKGYNRPNKTDIGLDKSNRYMLIPLSLRIAEENTPRQLKKDASDQLYFVALDTQPSVSEGHGSRADETLDILPHVEAMRSIAQGERSCPLSEILPAMIATDFRLPASALPSSEIVTAVTPPQGAGNQREISLKPSTVSPHAL